jgi:hypothetical protein
MYSHLRMVADYAQNTQPDNPTSWGAVGFPIKQVKVKANNKLMKECKKFMKFGVESVYPNDEGKQERYTWATLEYQVDPSQSGMHVKAMNGVLGIPLPGLNLSWKPEGKLAVEWTLGCEWYC